VVQAGVNLDYEQVLQPDWGESVEVRDHLACVRIEQNQLIRVHV
jgi:hypothetical protein